MKFLFDLLPVIFFYGTFKYAKAHSEWAAQVATNWLGFMVSGGVVGPQEAPTILATVVVVTAIALQVVWLKARKQPVPKVLLAGLALALIFGGLTVWFHSPTFIKWKFSIFYWLLSAVLLLGQLVWKRSLLKTMLGGELELPTALWNKLNIAWILFFLGMGLLNIYVAYNFSEDAWFNFKMFISTALMFVFMLGQGLFIWRHLPHESKQNS
ncbi:MAG TPA: septation protein A [Rhodocyclaceae bacterium]|nr:septation protein A [Rhodocyclaceae bacterium]